MTAPDSLIHRGQIAEMCEIARRTPDGCFVEVGVYKGGSAYHLAKVADDQGRVLHLYDTFDGIPWRRDGIDEHPVGDFADTSVDAVRAAIPTAVIHEGTFPGTLAATGPIAFVHVDCDQYQSVRACITELWARMVPGAVMLFDDYGLLRGATLAVDESFVPERLEQTSGGHAYVRKL